MQINYFSLTFKVLLSALLDGSLWNSMCYYFSSDSLSGKMSWQEALQACRRTKGGDLVSIHSASENNFIKSKIFRWVVFKKTSHWFFKPLFCCSACLSQFTNNFQTGDVLAFERGNTTLCHSAIPFRHVQLFFCYCSNHGVQNCNDYPNLVQVHIWPCQMFVLSLKSDYGNVSSDSNEDKNVMHIAE